MNDPKTGLPNPYGTRWYKTPVVFLKLGYLIPAYAVRELVRIFRESDVQRQQQRDAEAQAEIRATAYRAREWEKVQAYRATHPEPPRPVPNWLSMMTLGVAEHIAMQREKRNR